MSIRMENIRRNKPCRKCKDYSFFKMDWFLSQNPLIVDTTAASGEVFLISKLELVVDRCLSFQGKQTGYL